MLNQSSIMDVLLLCQFVAQSLIIIFSLPFFLNPVKEIAVNLLLCRFLVTATSAECRITLTALHLLFTTIHLKFC